MLSSAIYLGGDHDGAAPARSRGVQGLLDRFLEQLPASAAAAPSGEAVETGSAEGAFHAAQSSYPALPALAAAETSSADQSTQALIEKASRRYGVDSGLIRAVIKAESNFDPRAVSSAGARGLMQLMPATARGLGVTDSFDPEQNIMAGTRFLKDMLQRYGNVDDALAAYNWGPGNVDKHGSDRLPRETRTYLARVKGYMETA